MVRPALSLVLILAVAGTGAAASEDRALVNGRFQPRRLPGSKYSSGPRPQPRPAPTPRPTPVPPTMPPTPCAMAPTQQPTLSGQNDTIPAGAQQQVVEWKYQASTSLEMKLIICPKGHSVKLEWANMTNNHNVYKLPNENFYVGCNFACPAHKVAPTAKSGSHVFRCNEVGTHFFSCSVGDACSGKKQRVRVHVTDPDKTTALRAAKPNAVTLADVMAQHIVGFSYGDKTINETSAAAASAALRKVAENSPVSCSDYIPANENDNATCLAFVQTDLGYIARAKASPDLASASAHYAAALALKPSFCGAESYLTELKIKQGSKSEAEAQFQRACAACGSNTMDIADVKAAFAGKGWSAPTKCIAPGENSLTPSSNAAHPSATASGRSLHVASLLMLAWLVMA